jgi:hypothetical protein
VLDVRRGSPVRRLIKGVPVEPRSPQRYGHTSGNTGASATWRLRNLEVDQRPTA